VAKRRRVARGRIIEVVYDEFSKAQKLPDYNINDLPEKAFNRLASDTEVTLGALRRLIVLEVKKLDTQATKKGNAGQMELFGDLEGKSYALGGGRRVARSLAKWEHLQIVLSQSDDNLKAVRIANKDLYKQAKLLAPYMRDQGMNQSDAVEAFRRDHPGIDI